MRTVVLTCSKVITSAVKYSPCFTSPAVLILTAQQKQGQDQEQGQEMELEQGYSQRCSGW